MAEFKYTHLIDTLNAYGGEVAERYRAALNAHGKNASNRLYQSVRPVLEVSEDTFTLKMALEEYWKYLERGTRLQGPFHQQGKFPPLRPFVQWVQDKGIPLRPIPTTVKQAGKPVRTYWRTPTLEQMAYLIARKVWRDGTRPYWLLRGSLSTEEEITARVQQAIKDDIDEWLKASIAEIQ